MRKHIKQKKLLTNEPRSNPRLITIYHKQDTLIELSSVEVTHSSNTMINVDRYSKQIIEFSLMVIWNLFGKKQTFTTERPLI